MNRPALRARAGMTLVEMTVALLIFSFVIAGAVSMLQSETKRFRLGGERVAMYQNGRFAMNEMEKDMRTSGAGAPDAQPQLIYVSDSVMVFNANYWTNTLGDVEAVYYTPDAPDSAVAAMRTTAKITIPYTAILYPDTNYNYGAANSFAETIMFYFRRDSSTTRTDDFILWRRVNNLAPEVVATNILQTTGEPFFRYFRQRAVSTTLTLDTVPRASLPWRHSIPIHLSTTDTGTVARIDSIRAVRVSFTVTNGRTTDTGGEQTRALQRLIRLPNAGLANTRSCGDAPIFTSAISAADSINADSTLVVRLTWAPSVDENTGEQDVERYVIWRRHSSIADWGDPYANIGNGDSTYFWLDADVIQDSTYIYAVSAQDCTPSLSSQMVSATVTVSP